MKILITGAGGWLGSELTKKLLKEGNNVRAFTFSTNDTLNILKNKYPNLLEIIIGDICDKKLVCKSIRGVDCVYHLAAKVHYLPKNETEEKEFFKINTDASEGLFEICLNEKIKRVIFYSSVSVYGDSKEIINTNTPKNPSTAYAKSKLMAERIALKLFEEKGLPITIIEPVTVYGGNDIGNFERLKSLMNKGVAIKFGDGYNKKTIIYYKDLIDMTIRISKDSDSIGRVIICGTESINLNKIFEVLKKSVDKKVFILNFSEKTTCLIVNFLKKIKLGGIRKLERKIAVLISNNEYSLESSKIYIENYTKFEDYYI